jgi:hypothetical protein
MRSNYNSTKLCFIYFGVSARKAVDKAKAFVLDYLNLRERSKPKTP